MATGNCCPSVGCGRKGFGGRRVAHSESRRRPRNRDYETPWVHDLRKILSEYHSVLVSYAPEDYRKVSELGTQLDLMLNLEEAEQRELWDVAEEVFRTKDRDARIALDPKLMAAGRRVLKKEWQTIKWELRGKGLSKSNL